MKKERIVIKGDVPSPIELPWGCVFHPRCRFAQDICHEKAPSFEPYRDGCSAACHFIKEMVPLAIEKNNNKEM
jgi:oligopeptide/dipeptide ABC transporter ATP-binding protein